MQVTLDTHIEAYSQIGRQEAETAVRKGIPIVLSLLSEFLRKPSGLFPENEYYPAEMRSFLRDISQIPHVLIGQQGNTHRCFYKHRFRDPFHENYCTSRGGISLEQQFKLIKIGKETIEDALGKSPELYVPPNHLWDENTLIAARCNGFKYFADRAIIAHPAYEQVSDNGWGITIFPESKLEQVSETRTHLYTHLDEIPQHLEQWKRIIDSGQVISHKDVQPEKVSQATIDKNRQKLLLHKNLRDLRNFLL